MERIPFLGRELYHLMEELFPVCRSITGPGVRRSLAILQEYIKPDGIQMDIYEVPSGSQVFDWRIPKEWVIHSAYIEDEDGARILDMEKNNLHVVGYSVPVDKWVTLKELKSCVYTQPDQPDIIPYVTSYYKERYGFCMGQDQLEALEDKKYHIFIDSELIEGNLTYSELVLPGSSQKEIMFTSYICHPSMANNECSGPAVLAALMRYVNGMKKRKFTYRFVLNPETIGSITYLSRNLDILKERLVAGIVLSCVGDDRDYSIIGSRYGDTIADKSLQCILKTKDRYTKYSFLERGSDERQYNAPGIDLPVVGFCRTKYGKYPEYHTSADNMDIISPSGLQGSYETIIQWINCMEMNAAYRVTVLGEPQLGKRGLYPAISQKGHYSEVSVMMDLLAYADGRNDLFDIAEMIGVSPIELLPIVHKMKEAGLIKEKNNDF